MAGKRRKATRSMKGKRSTKGESRPLGAGAERACAARDTYRHGNLREAAVSAAFALAAEGGGAALSLRRVAEAVGVAHRSLYNHFADREALVDAVAEAGFEALASKLQTAATRGEFVKTYVRFVLDHSNLYQVMKSQPVSAINRKPGLQRAIQLSVKESARLFCDPNAGPTENRRAVIKVLILLYGGISMYVEGILEVSSEDELIAELQSMIP